MIETTFISMPAVWVVENSEEVSELFDESKKKLDDLIQSGFRVKLCTSSTIENVMYVHYVLEKEWK